MSAFGDKADISRTSNNVGSDGCAVQGLLMLRDKTRPVYDKWASEIGIDLVRSAESIVESAK
jgi:hypothetical protein